MHIPDGYLSLQTSIPAVGVMVPIWSVAVNKIKKTLNFRQIPLLSLCAAFSFVIMMFNIPLGTSSVHAVGATFIAILMEPWAACISVSVALIIQALLFGDGGILAIGANCFNMAVVMPFAGYYIYRLIDGDSETLSKRSVIGIFTGSYIGLNLAALFTAVEFGIQPLLFKSVEGVPQFGFYPLAVAVPAMMFEHLLIAGPIEGIVTVSAIAYLVKFNPQLFRRGKKSSPTLSGYKGFILGIIVITVLTPLGLFAKGTAWGEWGLEEIKGMIGYVPKGLEKFSEIWRAAMPDYSISRLDNGFFQSAVGYITCAIIGIALILAVMLVSSKFIVKKEE